MSLFFDQVGLLWQILEPVVDKQSVLETDPPTPGWKTDWEWLGQECAVLAALMSTDVAMTLVITFEQRANPRLVDDCEGYTIQIYPTSWKLQSSIMGCGNPNQPARTMQMFGVLKTVHSSTEGSTGRNSEHQMMRRAKDWCTWCPHAPRLAKLVSR